MTVKLDLPRGAAPELIFQRHYEHSSASFWRRFGGQIDVSGKRVLDFGCGTGGMVHRLMMAGARSAVGIDLSRRATDYARERLGADWGDAVEIICGTYSGPAAARRSRPHPIRRPSSSYSARSSTGPESCPFAPVSRSTNSIMPIGAASEARMPALMIRV